MPLVLAGSARRHLERLSAYLLALGALCGFTSLVLTHGFHGGTEPHRWGGLLEVPAVLLLVLEHLLVTLTAGSWRRVLARRWVGHIVLGLLLVGGILVLAQLRGVLHLPIRPETLARAYLIGLQVYIGVTMVVAGASVNRGLAKVPLHPSAMAFLTFILLIAVGSGLLMLPTMVPADSHLRWSDALFTATSAVCVTGLVVLDTGTAFTRLGQGVILLLIQLGGLGIMALAAFMGMLVGRRGVGLRERAVMRDILHVGALRQVTRVLRFIVVSTIAIELVGAAVLYLAWPQRTGRLFDSVFHAVSAFCNAGFSTNADSLEGVFGQPVILITVLVLLVLGGLGFVVLADLWRRPPLRRRLAGECGKSPRARVRLAVQTRMVLAITGGLLLVGWLGFLLLEWNGALAAMSWPEKLLRGLFMSATPRTAGFTATSAAQWGPPTALMLLMLMMIGGAPGSTAGGIKVTTLGVMLAAVRSMVRGRANPVVFRREVSLQTIREATAVITVYVAALGLGTLLLLITERESLQTVLFEVGSALGTVGLTLGLTPHLSMVGKCIIVVLMVVGRVGPITLALTVARRHPPAAVRYVEEKIMIG